MKTRPWVSCWWLPNTDILSDTVYNKQVLNLVTIKIGLCNQEKSCNGNHANPARTLSCQKQFASRNCSMAGNARCLRKGITSGNLHSVIDNNCGRIKWTSEVVWLTYRFIQTGNVQSSSQKHTFLYCQRNKSPSSGEMVWQRIKSYSRTSVRPVDIFIANIICILSLVHRETVYQCNQEKSCTSGQLHAYVSASEAAILLSAELPSGWHSPLFATRYRFR